MSNSTHPGTVALLHCLIQKQAETRVGRFDAQAHLHPVRQKIVKNSKKIQKNSNKFCVVDNLMREAHSKFHVIWTYEQLSAKKTNQAKIVHEQ